MPKLHISVGNYIETGKFRSVKSREGIKWSEAARMKHKTKKLLASKRRSKHHMIELKPDATALTESSLIDLKRLCA